MKNEIIKELHDISPFISDLRGKLAAPSDKIPKDYFEQLADNIIEKAKENPSFNETSINDLPFALKSSKKTNLLITVSRPIRAVAATFLLVAGSWWAFYQFSPKPIHPNASLSTIQVRRDVLKSFISDNIEDYDENVLVEKGILTDEYLNMPSINLKELNTNPELKKYLQENLNTPEDGDL